MRQIFFHGSRAHQGGGNHTSNWEGYAIVWMVTAFFIVIAVAIVLAVTREPVNTPSFPMPSWPL